MDQTLAGKRILIVEDEYLIASDLAQAIGNTGAEVVGPVADLKAGLALATNETLDAAVLDVNLKEGKSYPIAQALTDRAVPFMFLTGYDDWAFPEAYRAAPKTSKPCTTREVTSLVEQLVRS
jgi:DNA-binding response OmpR family regulator